MQHVLGNSMILGVNHANVPNMVRSQRPSHFYARREA